MRKKIKVPVQVIRYKRVGGGKNINGSKRQKISETTVMRTRKA
ncbi:MAG: hypothetical protein WC433_01850 [Candidatus Omnitrophota bacterium]|jgi:hypothetical protein